jgi:hypothetical protein
MTEQTDPGGRRPSPHPRRVPMPADVAVALADTAPDVLARLSMAGAPAPEGQPAGADPAPHRCGDAVWLEPHGTRPLTVISNRTGASWERGTVGWWTPAFGGPPVLELVDQLAELLLSREDQDDAVAVLLRQDIRAPGELFLDAQRAAVSRRRGADLSRLHTTRSRVLALLARTDPTPHRIVEVVDEPDVLLASCWADANTAVEDQWRDACLQLCQRYAARGPEPGRFTFSDSPFPVRAAAAADLERHLRWRRPGHTFVVEPVGEQ